MASSSKGKAKGSPKEESFYWNHALSKTLVELLVDYQRKVGRDQPFSWKTIRAQFEEATGKKCNTYTLENCNLDMKTHWGKWKALKHGETGLGWDAEKGTINATNDWWEKKIKENADFGIFRKKGVPPDLEDLWSQLYEGTVVTGEYCIVPSMEKSQRSSYDDGDDNDGDSDEDGDDDGDDGGLGSQCDPLGSSYAPVESEFDELFETRNGNETSTFFQDGLRGISETAPGHGSGPRPASASAPTQSQIQRGKRADGSSSTQGRAKRRLRKSTGSKLYQHVEMVQETNNKLAMLEKEEVSSNKPKSRIAEALDVVGEMVTEGLLVEGEPIWCFTVTLMGDPERRELFVCIKRNNSRMKWLQWLYEMNGGRIL